jgi:serine/threonine protein kinase
MAPGKPADQLGPYRVIRQIGSGGMACIFEAVDTRLGHRVAIKRLHPHVASRPGATERFLREGRASARVRHPHVVQVFALGAEGESAYLAMELLEGCDLGATLARQGRLGVEAALELLLPVIAAVAAAHDAGVVHRDLKPSNVFICKGTGGRRWPKVVDFGVSKVLTPDDAASVTGTDGVIGTAAYMAPEQARAARGASFQSDQYSLAVILYQCVTGELPFSGSGVYEVFSAIMTAPVALPSQRVDGIPSELDAIVLRAMSRNPSDRFPSVRAFGAALLALARPQDRAAWSSELLQARPGEQNESHVEPAAAREGGAGGELATPPTMPPTAKDTRVSPSRRRVASRAFAGILAGGVVVIITAFAWTQAGHAVAVSADSKASTNAAPRSASKDVPSPASTAVPPEPRAEDGRLSIPTDHPPVTLPTVPPLATTVRSATVTPTHPPKPGPPHPALAVTGSGSASGSVHSDPLTLGNNGSPILPP